MNIIEKLKSLFTKKKKVVEECNTMLPRQKKFCREALINISRAIGRDDIPILFHTANFEMLDYKVKEVDDVELKITMESVPTKALVFNHKKTESIGHSTRKHYMYTKEIYVYMSDSKLYEFVFSMKLSCDILSNQFNDYIFESMNQYIYDMLRSEDGYNFANLCPYYEDICANEFRYENEPPIESYSYFGSYSVSGDKEAYLEHGIGALARETINDMTSNVISDYRAVSLDDAINNNMTISEVMNKEE